MPAAPTSRSRSTRSQDPDSRAARAHLRSAPMKTADLVRLLLLAAIWGGSFLFMRVLAPVIGPVGTAASRVLLAGIVLLAWYRITGFDVHWRANLRHYAIIGGVGSALPFTLFAFAALHIP